MSTIRAAEEVYGELTPVEIQVSHRIQGRTPEAMNKPASELQDEDITTFWQRMAFICHVKTLTRSINGVEVHLCIGGTRSYSEDKLFGRPTPSKMKLFVGWFVGICSNGCLTTTGVSGTIECLTESDVFEKATALFRSFDPEKENALEMLENLEQPESQNKNSVTLSVACVCIRRYRQRNRMFCRRLSSAIRRRTR